METKQKDVKIHDRVLPDVNLANKLAKIAEVTGQRFVIKVGVDHKNNKIDLLSINFCGEATEEKEVIELPKDMGYIG